MNEERYHELLDRLLEGDLAADEAQELAGAVRSDAVRRRELRQQLVTWELWSQQEAPERSAEAFVRALQTRQRAEAEGDAFVAEVSGQIQREAEQGRVWRAFRRAARRLWEGLYAPTFSEAGRDRPPSPGLRRAGQARWFGRRENLRPQLWARPRQRLVRWCVLGSSAVAAALVGWLWTLPHAAHATVTLHGEAICTACTLHETQAHLPAIRVREGARTAIYYVDSGRLTVMRLGDYCVAPFPIVATGAPERHGARTSLRVDAAAREPRATDPGDRPEGRVLFPF